MITITELTKRYGRGTRQVVAVDRISFDVAPGTVTGFLGSNGAGKSTTLRILCGLADATSGSALIGGVSYRQLPNPGHTVGALLDASATHPGRTGTETLRLAAMSMGADRDRVTELLDLVGLTRPEASRRVGTYSLGMRQRLGIALALLGEPEVLVFDEPANGLDPQGIVWLRHLVAAIALTLAFAAGGAMTRVQGFSDVATLAVAPAGTLLTVVAILATTSEYANRSVMGIYLLEPHRGRVLAARALALVVVTFVSYGLIYLAAVPVNFIAAAFKNTTPDWSVDGVLLTGVVPVAVLYVLEAYAMGLLLLNGPTAIVMILVQPMVFSMIRTALPQHAGALAWVDPTTPSAMLRQGSYTPVEWATTGTGVAIWLVVPAIAGVLRVLRKEVS